MLNPVHYLFKTFFISVSILLLFNLNLHRNTDSESITLKNSQMPDEFNHYKVIRELLVKTTIMFSRKMTAFAMLEEQSDLQGLYGLLPEELNLIEDCDLLKKCNSIFSHAKIFIKDLTEYGIDEGSLNSFNSLINQFKQITANKESFIPSGADQ